MSVDVRTEKKVKGDLVRATTVNKKKEINYLRNERTVYLHVLVKVLRRGNSLKDD